MKEVENLVEKLKEKETFKSAVSSDEFLELVNVLYDCAEKSGFVSTVSEKVAKELSGDKVTDENIKLPRELENLTRAVYIHGLIAGLNLGRILTLEAVESVIKTALAKIDEEERDLRLKVAKILIYFFKDENGVNEVERRIMKILKDQGFSYRDIAKVIGRSLDTVHRHLKAEEGS